MSNARGSNWNYNRGNSGFIPLNSNRGGFGRGGGRGGPWRGGRKNFRGQPSRGFRGGNRPQNSYGNRNQNQQWNKPQRDSPGKRLSEEDIGVTEYISDHAGFLGIIKSRYSDFQVSEINEQGEIAKLTDLTPPTPIEDDVDEDEDLVLCKYNLEILPLETWDQINKLAVSADNSDDSKEKIEIDVTGWSKEQRTKVHDAVKKAFGDIIVGSTVTVDDKKMVKFEKFRKGIRVDNRVKWSWPGEYVYFIVHKENCDTMDAAARIAERLRLNIKPSMLGYAGTKDRRAKTSQWFSLRKVDPRRVASSTKDLRDIRCGNFTFSSNNLRLGMLKGNRFRIALRNVTVPDSTVDTACTQLKERGFINYYGLQRFGTRVETPTYDVGLKLLQGNFKEAIDGILEVREGPMQHALRIYKESGAEAALRAWPRRMRGGNIELRLVKALARDPRDLLGALNKLARNTRLLYLHSYQSLVWNRCVSERIRRVGLGVAVGDIVPLTSVHDTEEEVREDESDNEDDAETDSETQDEKLSDKTEDETVEATEKNTTEPKNVLESSIKQLKQKIPVKILTQEDVDSGKYTIFDVILPLPGNMVEYPSNIKDYYEELLTKDGLSLEMNHKIKSYSMSGAYRHMAIRPLDVTWSTVRYTDPYCDLVLSDWDEMQHKQLKGIVQDGKYKALLLNMTLPSSCYATMALRELLKVDTSCDNQALQNNYHKAKKTDGETKRNDVSKNGEKETKMEEDCQGEKRKLDSDSEVDAKKLKQEDQ